MNNTVNAFYQSIDEGHVEVVQLTSSNRISWDDILKKAPTIPKGWFELCLLEVEDRIEFTRDYWLKFFSYSPQTNRHIIDFFSRLDDVGVFLVRNQRDSEFIPHFIYSLDGEDTFFCGYPPERYTGTLSLPQDFRNFYEVHNGFTKFRDSGILFMEQLEGQKEEFLRLVEEEKVVIKCGEERINPCKLTPFYQSFGSDVFQCFYSEWYPDGEMGNVLCSLGEAFISDYRSKKYWEANLAFSSFSSWLSFYLEKMGGA